MISIVSPVCCMLHATHLLHTRATLHVARCKLHAINCMLRPARARCNVQCTTRNMCQYVHNATNGAPATAAKRRVVLLRSEWLMGNATSWHVYKYVKPPSACRKPMFGAFPSILQHNMLHLSLACCLMNVAT